MTSIDDPSENLSPEDGDEVIRRYGYQFSYGVLLLIWGFKNEISIEQLYAEHWDDYMIKMENESFRFYQIKTMERTKSQNKPFSFSDGVIQKWLKKCVKLEKKFSDKVEKYVFISSVGFDKSKGPEDLKNIINLIKESNDEDIPENSLNNLKQLTEETNLTMNDLKKFLKKCDLEEGPPIKGIESQIKEQFLGELPIADNFVQKYKNMLYDKLITRVYNASRNYHKDHLQIYLNLEEEHELYIKQAIISKVIRPNFVQQAIDEVEVLNKLHLRTKFLSPIDFNFTSHSFIELPSLDEVKDQLDQMKSLEKQLSYLQRYTFMIIDHLNKFDQYIVLDDQLSAIFNVFEESLKYLPEKVDENIDGSNKDEYKKYYHSTSKFDYLHRLMIILNIKKYLIKKDWIKCELVLSFFDNSLNILTKLDNEPFLSTWMDDFRGIFYEIIVPIINEIRDRKRPSYDKSLFDLIRRYAFCYGKLMITSAEIVDKSHFSVETGLMMLRKIIEEFINKEKVFHTHYDDFSNPPQWSIVVEPLLYSINDAFIKLSKLKDLHNFDKTYLWEEYGKFVFSILQIHFDYGRNEDLDDSGLLDALYNIPELISFYGFHEEFEELISKSDPRFFPILDAISYNIENHIFNDTQFQRLYGSFIQGLQFHRPIYMNDAKSFLKLAKKCIEAVTVIETKYKMKKHLTKVLIDKPHRNDDNLILYGIYEVMSILSSEQFLDMHEDIINVLLDLMKEIGWEQPPTFISNKDTLNSFVLKRLNDFRVWYDLNESGEYQKMTEPEDKGKIFRKLTPYDEYSKLGNYKIDKEVIETIIVKIKQIES